MDWSFWAPQLQWLYGVPAFSRYYYRAIATEHPKGRVIAGDLIVAFMWYWILYHLWYEPEHLFVSTDSIQ